MQLNMAVVGQLSCRTNGGKGAATVANDNYRAVVARNRVTVCCRQRVSEVCVERYYAPIYDLDRSPKAATTAELSDSELMLPKLMMAPSVPMPANADEDPIVNLDRAEVFDREAVTIDRNCVREESEVGCCGPVRSHGTLVDYLGVVTLDKDASRATAEGLDIAEIGDPHLVGIGKNAIGQ